jgi:hypothetical protein
MSGRPAIVKKEQFEEEYQSEYLAREDLSKNNFSYLISIISNAIRTNDEIKGA